MIIKIRLKKLMMSGEDDIPPIQSMEQFQNQIREWVGIDNQINKYNTKFVNYVKCEQVFLTGQLISWNQANRRVLLLILLMENLNILRQKPEDSPTLPF